MPVKDFFISYNGKDKEWAEWIAWQLDNAGYTTVIQAWDFRPGSNFVIDMQRTAEETKRTIAVLSENYLNAMYTQPEWAAAFAQDPTGTQGILVPVRIQECSPKGILAQIVYIDLVGKEEDEAREVLLAGVQSGRGKPAIAPGFPEGSEALPRIETQKPAFPLKIEHYEPETVIVPEGAFIMGNDAGKPYEAPQHTLELPEYRIGKFPITNRQYAEFIRRTGRVVDPALLWDGNIPPAEILSHPVAGVTWYEALAYCEWLSEQTGRLYRLPSEAQWEKAARTSDGRLYPWGNEWEPERCNSAEKIMPVDLYSAQNEFGCFDMVGNVREWTTTLWGGSREQPDPLYSGKWQHDGRDNLNAPKVIRRIYRGGRSKDPLDYRCSFRQSYFPEERGPRRARHGFRIVLLPKTLSEGEPDYG